MVISVQQMLLSQEARVEYTAMLLYTARIYCLAHVAGACLTLLAASM